MPYKETSYRLEEDAKGIRGIRVFTQDASGDVATLPIVLTDLMPDEAGSGIPNCLARRKVTTYQGNIPVVTVQYNTSDGISISGGINVSDNPDSRTFDTTTEIVHMDSPTQGWNWDGGTDVVDTPMGKLIVLSRFTIPIAGLTTAQKNTFRTSVLSQAGTINDAAFEGFAIGQVRFDGIRGGDRYDESGDQTWAFELEFTAKIINDTHASTPSQDHWNYEWRSSQSAANTGWYKPELGASKWLYKASTFGDPVAGTGLFNY